LSLAFCCAILNQYRKENSMNQDLHDVTITDEQALLVNQWLDANSKVRGWLDSYALGQSYIDTRANGGKGITARRRYVALDHQVAAAVPELGGYHASDIRLFMAVRTPETPMPMAAANLRPY
jgi:hypothetical protein